MSDIWGFLLQTLTASGVAVLLLAVKWMFRDKLSPRWQFAAWSVLVLLMLLPAGRGGRYTLLNWPFYVEVLRAWLTGDYSVLTRVAAPVPLFPREMPHTLWDWLFVAYLAGCVFFLGRYFLSYFRLRLALKRGMPGGEEQVKRVATQYGLPRCRSVKVEGLSTAFICGFVRPVLALPAGQETEDKVILHELLHYKNRDVIWGLVICLFRCIHWCNPFLWTCADLAGNDLEALCDQRVLERLEGEDRRDYGRILLGMADEKYARAPGTSSIANGGKNIRRRIEAIARFKRYPKGMALVSVCVLLVLAAPLAAGSEAKALPQAYRGSGAGWTDLIYARSIFCTTYGGALDTYAKAVMSEQYVYRTMCASLAEMNTLIREGEGKLSWASIDFSKFALDRDGYRIYGLTQVGEEAYEGMLVLGVMNLEAPENQQEYQWLAVQTVRAQKEEERWVVIPQEEFWPLYAEGWSGLPSSGVEELVSRVYEGQAGDFKVRVNWSTYSFVDSYKTSDGIFPITYFDREPQPNGELTTQAMSSLRVSYVGKTEDKEKYSHIGVSFNPMEENGERPKLPALLWADGYIGSSEGYEGMPLEEGWEEVPPMGGCGAGYGKGILEPPPAYAVDLYLNKEKIAELTLLPKEGVTVHDR